MSTKLVHNRGADDQAVRRSRGDTGTPPTQADNDQQLIGMWLHGKSANTREAYLRDVNQFMECVSESLQRVRLIDLQNWDAALASDGLADSTRARKLAAVKSLYSFGHKIGYFIFNIGAAVQGPKVTDDLSERILLQEEVFRMLDVTDGLRDRMIVRLFYSSGGRVSELAALCWKSVVERPKNKQGAAGQISLHGKGDKVRHVLLSSATWDRLMTLKLDEREAGYGNPPDPVFRSRKGGHLSRQQLWYIVKRAARRAGCDDSVSPHWLRHAHASHALDDGAPVHLVKETLGHKSLATTSRYTHARPDDSSSNYLDV